MKDGAIISNAGHFNREINIESLKESAVESSEQREHIIGYKMNDGRWIYVIADAGLVNIAAGNGHPAEIMDLSFALQALSAQYMVQHHKELAVKVHKVPQEIDHEVANLKLASWGYAIDSLTEEQVAYMGSWKLE
jgi:adenosylhomocysteinase